MYKKITAPLILLLGAIYLYFFRIPKMKVMSQGSHSLLLPKILLVLLMILSGIVFLQVIIRGEKSKEFNLNQDGKVFLLSFILCALYLYGMTIVGYFVLTPVFLFVFTYLLGSKKWWLNGVVSLGLTAVIYLLFIKMLYVPLPKGIGIFKVINEFILYS